MKPEDQFLGAWRRKIGRANNRLTRALEEKELYDFCEDAFRFVASGDAEATHQVITSLATEGGLARILEIMKINFGQYTDHMATMLFQRTTLPLLQVITHKDVLSSLILEAPKGTIFNFLYGIEGKRAVAFFEELIKLLFRIAQMEASNRELLAQSLASVITALAQTIECNQTANLVQAFHNFLESFKLLLESSQTQTSARSLPAQHAARQLLRIRTRLEFGASIDSALDRALPPKTPALSYDVAIDGPGQLSVDGPRHDNDHEDICEIEIMPTADEISSRRSEYLPTSDPAKWHVGGIKGLLDRQFRLLREDTIGQLRDCVHSVMEELGNTGRTEADKRSSQQGTRYFVYQSVVLSDMVFEERGNRGIQVVAEFDQPQSVRATTKANKRQQWWSETKQLQVDSLLCLVDSNGKSVFLSVSQRHRIPEVTRNSGNGSNLSQPSLFDPNAAPEPVSEESAAATDQLTRNLWLDQSRCAVTLQLVDLNTYGITEIIGRSQTETNVRQVLVEFPGVLLPSFRPTLEALKEMSKRGDIPFRNLIAPVVTDGEALDYTELGPPGYASQLGFTFDLHPITGNHALTLDPLKTFESTSLMQHTTLDEAQCKALVNALSRSLALIQGPPGTGKSYVAVQIVKVLLAKRQRAEMGPIVCV